MVQENMLEGVWITDPKAIKVAFLNFYKDKFSCHDSLVSFTFMLPSNKLSIHDRDSLEVMVSLDEIKTAVWDCGSQKAPDPDGYSFMFIEKFWELLKHDIHTFVVNFFSTGKFSQGSNSAFITLIHNVSTSLFIYRPILLIGLHKKIAAKSLQIDCPRVFFKRGVRQEDPLSPFLFIIIKEGLHMTLHDGLAANMFHGVKILIDRFKARLLKWKANLLSVGGRLNLIKSMLGSLGIYYLSLFKALESIVKALESFYASFFWGGSEDSKKLA
ncbi:hypothetical protein Tco_0032012 [Tanacetum coccineum]